MAAAEIAGVSDRTMRRIKQRYEEFGYDGLFDQRRGKGSLQRIPMETAERVLGMLLHLDGSQHRWFRITMPAPRHTSRDVNAIGRVLPDTRCRLPRQAKSSVHC